MKPLSRDQIQQIDEHAVREFGVPSLILMENAGRTATDVLCELGIEGPVVICCGRGNNAGDGLVMARHLDLRGHEVKVLHWTDQDAWRDDPAIHFEITMRSGIPCQQLADSQSATLATALASADWIVDALLGTGTRGAPRAPFDDAIRLMNEAQAKKFAIDIPTGLDCDTGEVSEPTFQADWTCTFVAPKRGLLEPAAQHVVGQLRITDIGAPRRLLEEYGVL